MPHTYSSKYPAGIQVDSGIKRFFEEFYQTSDTPDAHEKYADSFTEDATLIMASKKGVGRQDILQIRKGMWEKVSARLHRPIKIFPFGAGSDELMLFGTVKYTFKDGRECGVSFLLWLNDVKL